MRLSPVLGCEACMELKQERTKAAEIITNMTPQGGVFPVKEKSHEKSKQLNEDVKVPTNKNKSLFINRMEGDPEWWGTGVARIISVSPINQVEDVENELCERTYSQRMSVALEQREQWALFLRQMSKKYSDAMSKNLGPNWFQDLSDKQIGYLDRMEEIIETDLQEEITSRTRKAIAMVGIHPPLPANEVRRCMSQCAGNVVNFLFFLHKLIVEREQGVCDKEFEMAAKEGRPFQQVYSTNERILLSGVFHLHFNEFTSKLDQLLPLSPEKPKIIIAKKPKPEPKKKYKSPYLEPQPMTPKVWYEQRAEDEMYAQQARLVALQLKREFEKKVLREAEEQKRLKEDKLRKLFEQKYSYGTSKSLKKSYGSNEEFALSNKENKSQFFRRSMLENKEGKSLSGGSSQSSRNTFEVSKSMQHMKKNKRYMYDVVHESVQTKTSYGGFFSKDNKLIKDTEGANFKIRLVPRNEKVVCLYKDEDFKPVQVLDTRVRICCRDVGIQTMAEPMFLPVDVSPEMEFYRLMDKITAQSEAFTNTENCEETPQTTVDVPVVEPVVQKTVQKNALVECTDENCALVEADIAINEFTLMKRKIELYPPEKQLKAAVAFLCRRGDPLGILPKVEDTPWLIRWFELRRGYREKLTTEDKDELMQISQKLWMSGYKKVNALTVPSFKIKKKITSLDKPWLMKKIDTFKLDYRTKLRQQLVMNAREFFPTLYSEYFNTPLCKSLRRTFFTYLSSKEMDAYVCGLANSVPKNRAKRKKDDGSN